MLSCTLYPDLDGYPELDLLSKALSFSSPSLRVSTRIEAYSCKPIARERKLLKTITHDVLDNLSHSKSFSPPEHHSELYSSAFGPLDRKDSRKTLWLLIATLNIAFPDHDFSTLSAEEFVKEDSPRIVLASLTSALSHLRSSNGQEGPPAMPLNLSTTGLGLPSALDSYHKTYSSSAPASHASTSNRKAIEQKATSKTNTSAQGKGQTKGNGKAGSSNGKTASPEAAAAGDDNLSSEQGVNDADTNARNGSASASLSKKASQHQPRAKSSTSSSALPGTYSSSSSKKKQSPISHTTLISKLRNELDGTYEVPTHPLLRQVLDPIIDLSECDVYSYTPDLDSDPHAYQSEDEEDEDEEDDGEDDGEFERHSDGLDMDLEDDEYYRPAMTLDNDTNSWDMEGVESTPATTSAPNTPSASNQQGAFVDGQTSPIAAGGAGTTVAQGKKSAQKKRANAGGASAGSAKRQSRSSKGGSASRGGGSASSSSRTRIVPGASIFGDAQRRGVPFQYGSLDEYSYNYHQSARQQSSRRSPLHMEGMSSNDGTEDDEENEEEDDDDADNGGLLWSSNYFFYNRKMKRILFVSVWGRKIGKQFSPSNALLARSAGNPLHAYRRHLRDSMGGSGAGGKSATRDGRVTINLNRPRAGSNVALPPSVSSASGGNDENGSSAPNVASSWHAKASNNTPSNLTNALRANADSPSTLNPSFSSQPPIAHAASIFKPSSPIPRSDNRTTVPGTPSNLNPSRGGDDPQPPTIRDSTVRSGRNTTPAQSPASALDTAASRGARRVRQHSSGASTPSRRKSARKSNSRRASGASSAAAAGNAQ